MNLAKLKKQLRNELKKNPRKVGLLALLAGVGLYFWVPLVGSWMSDKKASTGSTLDLPATAQRAAAGAQADTAESTAPGLPHWRELAHLLSSDAQMKPAFDLVDHRDPFRLGEPAEGDEAQSEKGLATAEPLVNDLSPAAHGLSLSGTAVGKRRRMALINNRAYAEGSQIRADGGITYRLLAIAPHAVWLECEGKPYELPIEPPDWSSSPQAVASAPTAFGPDEEPRELPASRAVEAPEP